MKNIFLTIFYTLIFLLITPLFVCGVHAASLRFDNTTYSVAIGADINVGVIVDAGSEQINSSDIYVLYDPTLLEARTVIPGTYFPTFSPTITSGKVYIAGLVDDAANSKTGSGTVATITFRGLRSSRATLTFDCQTNAYNTSKIVKNDLNATNIIVCTQNGTAAITVGTGATSATTPTGTSGSSGAASGSTSLPRTGIFENVVRYAIPGAILFIVGTAVRLIL
jgi:hypothetical protein